MKKSFLILILLMSITITSVAQLSWSKQEHDFGVSQKNVPLAYEFTFINYSAKTVRINYIKASSYAIKPQWNKQTLAPDEMGNLLIAYKPNTEGSYKETIEIYLDNNPYPQIITLTGVIGDGDFAAYYKPALTSGTDNTESKPTSKIELTPPSYPVATNTARPSTKPSVAPSRTISRPAKPNNTEISVPSKPSVKPPVKPTKKPSVKPSATVPSKPKPSKPAKPTVATTATSSGSAMDLSTTIARDYLGAENLNTAVNESYLSKREKAMVKEINLVRSNPKGYIKVVEAYVVFMKADEAYASFYEDEIKVADELIEELKNTPVLSILKPSETLYKIAKAHGDEGKSIGDLGHVGKDGLMPWDRVIKYDAKMQDGNENIVGGPKDIRRSVLTLLVDAGISNRGHRKTLLNPKWTHVSTYEIGKIGNMPYMWLQQYGQAKNGNSSVNPAIPGEASGYDAITTYDTDTKPKPGKRTPPSSATPNRSLSNPVTSNNEAMRPGRPNTGSSTSISANTNAPMAPAKPKPKKEEPLMTTSNLAMDIMPNKKCQTASKEVYMKNNEKEMIAEINFLRSDPKGYIKVIDAYIDFMDNEISKDETAKFFYNKELKSAEELIELLERIQPLNILKPNSKMYTAAYEHGEYGKATGNLEKEGSDGSMPHNRMMKYAENVMDGDENLPRGSTNVRYSIIKLLIDKDDYKRMQRKVLLNPNWDFVAVYEVGKVGNMHYWVQDFGQARPESKAMFDIETSAVEQENTIMGYATTQTFTETLISTEVQPAGNIFDVNKASFLSEKEQMLLREINFVRSNPKQYALIMGAYIEKLKNEKTKNPEQSEFYDKRIEAAIFIKDELTKATATPILVPNENIYQAAYQHGQDCQRNFSLTHWGSDGSNTWQRLQKNAPTIIDGDQCLVGDTDDIRESVISVLIDHAIYSRNREIILLKSTWTSFAASAIGKVGRRENCWVITLGQF